MPIGLPYTSMVCIQTNITFFFHSVSANNENNLVCAVPNKPSVMCNATSSTGVSLTLTANGEVDFYSIITVCPWERYPSPQCNTTTTVRQQSEVSAGDDVHQSINDLNAYKVYTFNVIAVKNSTTSVSPTPLCINANISC